MAGVNVETAGNRGRRSVDSEINLIPMIDLFIVCISFLLITAVWSQMGRLNASANVPGYDPDAPPTRQEAERVLTIEMGQEDRFVLSWRSGEVVHVTTEVPRRAQAMPGAAGGQVRYPDLAREIEKQWREQGMHHNDDDARQDRAVLRVDNRTPFSDIVAVIDAIYAPKRTFKGEMMQAFNVTFSSR